MATTQTFSAMLNEYLPNKLLETTFEKKFIIWEKAEVDHSWLGGTYVVPFEGGEASSIAFGSLTDSSDIGGSILVRGEITSPKEAWGSMIFNHRDIMEHGKLSEQNLLKLLPNKVNQFTDYMKMVMALNLLNGAIVDTLVVNGDAANGAIHAGATGWVTVAHPERFRKGQKITLKDSDSNTDFYIAAIDINTKVLKVSSSRENALALTLASASAFTTAASAVIYQDGGDTAGFTGLSSILLSAANGGALTLYGQTKITYPYLQAINISGAGFTINGIVSDVFDAWIKVSTYGNGNPTDVLMSYKLFGYVLKSVEASKGGFNVVPGSAKASMYGWKEIGIGGPGGDLKIVGVKEMDDTVIFIIDWSVIKFATNGGFKKRVSPDGDEYFEVRATTGYSYVVDLCVFGELVVLAPSHCGIVYGLTI